MSYRCRKALAALGLSVAMAFSPMAGLGVAFADDVVVDVEEGKDDVVVDENELVGNAQSVLDNEVDEDAIDGESNKEVDTTRLQAQEGENVSLSAGIHLTDSIDLYCYVTVPAATADSYTVTYSYNGVTPTPVTTKALSECTPYATTSDAKIYEFLVAQCAAKEMTNYASFKVTDAGGTVCENNALSIDAYCNSVYQQYLIKQSSGTPAEWYSDALMTLCDYMLTYGNRAQYYWEYDGNHFLAPKPDTNSGQTPNFPPNKVLPYVATEDGDELLQDSDYDWIPVPAYTASKDIAATNFDKVTASLDLSSKFGLNIYITPNSAFDISTESVEFEVYKGSTKLVAGTDYTFSYLSSGRFVVRIKGIKLKDLDKAYKVEIKEIIYNDDYTVADTKNGSVTYTPLQHAHDKSAGNLAETPLGKVSMALYQYYNNAISYPTS